MMKRIGNVGMDSIRFDFVDGANDDDESNSDLTTDFLFLVDYLRSCVLDVDRSWLLILDNLGIELYWVPCLGQCWVLVDHEGLFPQSDVAFRLVDG